MRGAPEIERDREDEARERTRRADVEQRATGADRAAHPDHRSHRPERRQVGHRDEERERGVDLVDPGRDVVPGLVRDQDDQERPGEEEPVLQGRRREGATPPLFPALHPGEKDARDRGDEELGMEPPARSPRACRIRGQPRRRAGRAVRRARGHRGGRRRAARVGGGVGHRGCLARCARGASRGQARRSE